MSGEAWPIRDAVKRLADAGDHLLIEHDCDADGYELTSRAIDAARAWLAAPDETAALRARVAELEGALSGLLDAIKDHHDGACPGITPADCLDAIYESANVARAALGAKP